MSITIYREGGRLLYAPIRWFTTLAGAQAGETALAMLPNDSAYGEPERDPSAWELEHADGAFCGSASSQTLLAPQPAPELPPAIAALAEAQMADDPHVGSLKAGEVGRDEEE